MSNGGQNRANIKVGAKVKIVLKAGQRTGNLTKGVVARLLTKSSFHPHGIKVMLEFNTVCYTLIQWEDFPKVLSLFCLFSIFLIPLYQD